MRKIVLFVVAAAIGMSTQAVAQEEGGGGEEGEKPAEGSKVQEAKKPVKAAASEAQGELGMKKAKGGYGSAGCGLGSLLFEPSNSFTQVFAATTNATSWTQTFGITSGTSNCDGSGYQAGSAAAFIQTNRTALAKDIARGKGATITGLADVAGCSDSRAVGKKLQRSFKTIFPNAAASDQQVTDSVINVLKSDRALSCTNLG